MVRGRRSRRRLLVAGVGRMGITVFRRFGRRPRARRRKLAAHRRRARILRSREVVKPECVSELWASCGAHTFIWPGRRNLLVHARAGWAGPDPGQCDAGHQLLQFAGLGRARDCGCRLSWQADEHQSRRRLRPFVGIVIVVAVCNSTSMAGGLTAQAATEALALRARQYYYLARHS